MEIFTLIATIIGLIVGSIELYRYLNGKDQEERKPVRLIFILTIVVLITWFAFNIFYTAPRQAGERFIAGFQDMDVNVMSSSLCADSPMRDSINGPLRILLTFGKFLANFQVTDISFDPFSRQMSFRWTGISSLSTQQPTQHTTIYLKSSGLTDFCVYNATGF